MGLSISTGVLASNLQDGDPDLVKSLRRDLKRINRLLVENNVPQHVEPVSIPAELGQHRVDFDRGMRRGLWLSDMPYEWFLLLKRAVAHAMHGKGKLKPAPEDYECTEDPVFADAVEIYMDSHIVAHSNSEGYFVPVDFDELLLDNKLPGGFVGSSQASMRELVQTAKHLGISLRRGKLSDEAAQELAQEAEGSHPFWMERHTWLCLFENLRLSVETKSMVVFG